MLWIGDYWIQTDTYDFITLDTCNVQGRGLFFDIDVARAHCQQSNWRLRKPTWYYFNMVVTVTHSASQNHRFHKIHSEWLSCIMSKRFLKINNYSVFYLNRTICGKRAFESFCWYFSFYKLVLEIHGIWKTHISFRLKNNPQIFE